MRHARYELMLAAVVMILFVGAVLEAAEPMVRSEGPGAASPVGVTADASAHYEPMNVFGVQVFIDPKTGLMRTPSPEEAAALAAEMQRQFGGQRVKGLAQPKQVTLANGTVMSELDPSLYSVSVVRILPDGTAEFGCVENHDHGIADASPSHAGAETE